MHGTPQMSELLRHESSEYVGLLCGKLESAGLPTATRKVIFPGWMSASSNLPTLPPGIRFVLLVPSHAVPQARDVLMGLPAAARVARPQAHRARKLPLSANPGAADAGAPGR